jgi:predicted dehydrogenase
MASAQPGYNDIFTTANESSNASRRLRVGLIGCGDVAQIVHIPTLGFMSDRFEITYLCDVSAGAMEKCQNSIAGNPAKTTKDPSDLCSSPNVDIVFVLSSDEYHADQAILALEHGKLVFIEKPVSLNLRDVDRIIEAEKKSKGRAMVGYMRRFASAFVDGVREIGGLDKILYARVRGKLCPTLFRA